VTPSKPSLTLLVAALLASPLQAQDDVKAKAKVTVEVGFELALVLKKEGFPVPKDSPLGDAAALEKTLAGIGPKSAKKAASLYRWGAIFSSAHPKRRQAVVSLFVTGSPESANALADLMLLREQATNKAIAKDGGELLSKKNTVVKPKGSSGGYAYERTVQFKDGRDLTLDKVLVSSGRYVIEVALVTPKGEKNLKLIKRLTSAAMRGVRSPGAPPR